MQKTKFLDKDSSKIKNYGSWNPNEFAIMILDTNDEIPNITDEWFVFLDNQPYVRDSTFDIGIISKKRGGKTIFAITTIDRIMLADKKRFLICYKNERIPEILQNVNNFKNRVACIHNIIEADKYVDMGYKLIIFIDEGVLTANAKSALKKDMKELGQAFASSSHKDVILIVNAQDDGVIKDLRGKSEITIYKRLTRKYVLGTSDPMVSQKKELLISLSKLQAYCVSEHFDFDKVGIIEFNAFKYLTWLTPELDEALSKNDALSSFSQPYNKELEELDTVKELAQDYLDDKGIEFCLKSKSHVKDLKYFLTQEYSLKYYKQVEHLISKIDIFVCGMAKDGIRFDNSKKKEEKKLQMKKIIEVNEKRTGTKKEKQIESKKKVSIESSNISFSEFVQDNLSGTLDEIEIVVLYLQGQSYRDIMKDYAVDNNKITRILKKFVEKNFEHLFVKYLKLITIIEFEEKNGYFIDNLGKLLGIDQIYTSYYIKNKNKYTYEFDPQILFKKVITQAKKLNHETIGVFIYNRIWYKVPMLTTIDVNSTEIVLMKQKFRYNFKVHDYHFKTCKKLTKKQKPKPEINDFETIF